MYRHRPVVLFIMLLFVRQDLLEAKETLETQRGEYEAQLEQLDDQLNRLKKHQAKLVMLHDTLEQIPHNDIRTYMYI